VNDDGVEAIGQREAAIAGSAGRQGRGTTAGAQCQDEQPGSATHSCSVLYTNGDGLSSRGRGERVISCG